MAKIDRYNGNLQAFASGATGNYRTIFGDVTQSDTLDDNVNADYLSGWEIVGITEAPSKQDFNALGFTHGQLLAYIHQMGVAEYNASQEYHTDSVCTYDGAIYISLTDSNTGNTPDSSPSNWTAIVTTASMSALYYTKVQLDAGQLDNRYYTETESDSALALKLNIADIDDTPVNGETSAPISSNWAYDIENSIGAANGICPLDGSGLVDSSYLPSYVDDIVEVATYSALPGSGESGKIYIITTDGDGHIDEVYRWSGSAYIQIGANILQSDDSLRLGNQLPAYYTNASNMDAGTLPVARLDSTVVLESDVDDTPVNGATTDPISSNWAYDHVNAADPHTVYPLDSEVVKLAGSQYITGAKTFNTALSLGNNIPLYGVIQSGMSEYELIKLDTSDQVNVGNASVPLLLKSSGTLEHNGDIIYDETTLTKSVIDTLTDTHDDITATSEGVAASATTQTTFVTTNGDSDLDNVTLADGTEGQIKHIVCVSEGNAADTWKITPANMIGGTQITFSGVGEGCTLVMYSGGWVVSGNNGGTIS